jgi:hypothetical protein
MSNASILVPCFLMSTTRTSRRPGWSPIDRYGLLELIT